MVVPYKICFFPCNAQFASLRAIPEARNAYAYAAAAKEGGIEKGKNAGRRMPSTKCIPKERGGRI